MRPSSPYAYLAAVGLVLLGWVAAVSIAAGAWDPVKEASLTPVTEKRADADGRSLAVYTDIVQGDRDIRCRARDEQDVATDLPESSIDLTVERDGTEWHLIALLPRGRDGLKVRCGSTDDDRVDNATYSYAVVDGFTSRGSAGNAVAVAGLVAGLGLAGWTFRNRRADRTTTTTT